MGSCVVLVVSFDGSGDSIVDIFVVVQVYVFQVFFIGCVVSYGDFVIWMDLFVVDVEFGSVVDQVDLQWRVFVCVGQCG